jgi:hypothetical protein
MYIATSPVDRRVTQDVDHERALSLACGPGQGSELRVGQPERARQVGGCSIKFCNWVKQRPNIQDATELRARGKVQAASVWLSRIVN